MCKSVSTAILFSLWIGVTGCASIAGPRWFQSDPPHVQQGDAALWDPWPDNDVAPEALEARPPGFQRALPEADHRRWPFRPLP